MSTRVTADEVKQIIETDLENSIIEAYIGAANALVTKTLGLSSLGMVLLKEIERWISAHMIATTRERQAIKEEAGTAKVQYSDQFGMGLSSSTYGQMAMSLDTTGALSALARKPIILKAIKV